MEEGFVALVQATNPIFSEDKLRKRGKISVTVVGAPTGTLT
jgi:hypothetical protein